MQTTGIIMAGGKSSRMGTNKALLKINGVTVIEQIAHELQKAVTNIIVVTNTPEEYEFLGLPMVADQWKGMGPLAGIHAGLTASQTEKNLVVACDMPFISSQIGMKLLQLLDEYQAAVPKISGQLHPLFAAYRKDVAGAIQDSLEKNKLRIRYFLDGIHSIMVTEEDLKGMDMTLNERFFFNMNHPEEFEQALTISTDHTISKRESRD